MWIVRGVVSDCGQDLHVCINASDFVLYKVLTSNEAVCLVLSVGTAECTLKLVQFSAGCGALLGSAAAQPLVNQVRSLTESNDSQQAVWKNRSIATNGAIQQTPPTGSCSNGKNTDELCHCFSAVHLWAVGQLAVWRGI